MNDTWLSPRARRVALVTVAVIAGWLLLDLAWLSDAERLELQLQAARAAAERREVDVVMAMVAGDYQDRMRDKAAIRARLEAFLAQYDPAQIRLSVDSVSVAGDGASAEVVYFAKPGPRSQMPAPIRGRLTLTFRRNAAGREPGEPPPADWLLTHVAGDQ